MGKLKREIITRKCMVL